MKRQGKRDKWNSSLGFILSAMGSAVGLGNIWRFPTVVALNGGGAFFAIYLVIIFIVGIPTIIAELAIGKKSQHNVVTSFSKIKPDKKNWKGAGYLSMIASFVVLSFYSVIAGWTIIYLAGSISRQLLSGDAQVITRNFEIISQHPYLPIIGQVTFLLFTTIIVIKGISKGIERVNKVLMPGIIVILLILFIRTAFLPGAIQGILWFLKPEITKINFQVALNALGQVFFSFSLGMGAMITYGSYLGHQHNVPKSALIIAVSDLGVAILAGLTIIPALFAFGIPPETGPGLIFVTLPAIFSTLPLNILWASLFFMMLLFAALSSSVSILETSVAYLVDERKWSRTKAAYSMSAGIFALGIPSALSKGKLSGLAILGRNFFDFMDFLASNILLTLAGFLTVVFVGWIWGTKSALIELETNHPFKQKHLWSLAVRYVVPLAIAYIFVTGII